MNAITIQLPSSKSISNRLLIIQALCQNSFSIFKLSNAQDTQDLDRCLNSLDSLELHVGDGATSMRFLLAYLALRNQSIILSCGKSLKGRPIFELIQVLEMLHCEFNFLEEPYKMPLKLLKGISEPIPKVLEIDGSLSSQFVSAILLIGPYLGNPISIKLKGHLVSEPYLNMTIQLMRNFGIQIEQNAGYINIPSSKYTGRDIQVEADWSAAVFFYALLGLQDEGKLYFPGLKKSGLQGDEALIPFFRWFGIQTLESDGGISIEKLNVDTPSSVGFDFTDCPDLFPAMAIFCAMKKVNCYFSGLQNLKHKESNRLDVISEFLIAQKVKIIVPAQENGVYYFEMKSIQFELNESYATFMDHRIAMAFSLLKLRFPIFIENPEAVSKSFPDYWDEYKKLELEFIR